MHFKIYRIQCELCDWGNKERAEKMNNIQVGDIVWRKDGMQLRSGCCAYNIAIVISICPFAIASKDGDMLWQSTVKLEDFEALSKAPEPWYSKAMRRLSEVTKRPH